MLRGTAGLWRKVVVVTLVATVLAGLAAPAAYAAEHQQERSVWVRLHQEMEEWIRSTGAREAFENLGLALYLFLGMVQAYSAVMGRNAGGVSDTVFRVIMAGFLISLVKNGTMGEIIGTAYRVLSEAGIAIFWRSRNALASGLAGLAANIKQVATGFAHMVAGKAVGLAAMVVIGLMGTGLFVAVLLANLMFAALYIAINLVALMILSIALLLSPLSFAAFAFRSTSQWTWRWVSAVMNALVTVLAANLVGGAVFWIAVRGPEALLGSLPGPAQAIGEFLAAFLSPILFLVLAPAFGFVMLLRIENIVAHFTEGFGNLTGAVEQFFTMRWLWPYVSSAAGAVVGRLSGGAGVPGGPTGLPAPGPRGAPSLPAGPGRAGIPPAPAGGQSIVMPEAPRAAPAPPEAPPTPDRPAYLPRLQTTGMVTTQDEADLRNWSERVAGFGITPWLWDSTSLIPTYRMSGEQVMRMYRGEMEARGYLPGEVKKMEDRKWYVTFRRPGSSGDTADLVTFRVESDTRREGQVEVPITRIVAYRGPEDTGKSLFIAEVSREAFEIKSYPKEDEPPVKAVPL